MTNQNFPQIWLRLIISFGVLLSLNVQRHGFSRIIVVVVVVVILLLLLLFIVIF